MKCKKCGYENSIYDIICEKCGTPLNIEENDELKDKYNNKPRAIDIEEIVPSSEKYEFDDTKQKVKYVLSFLLGAIFVSVIVLCVFLIRDAKSKDILTKYNKFMKSDYIEVIYLGKEDEVSKLLKEYENKYEIKFLFINVNKITSVKKNKIKDDLDLDVVNSTVVIVKNGKVIDHIDKSNSNLNKVRNLLIENDIIPKEDGNPEVVKKNFDLAMDSQDSVIMYIANNKNDSNASHNEFIKKFCDNYSINYVFIEGYYLSDFQKLSLLNKLNYSDIHDELFVIVDEGEIKEVNEVVNEDFNHYFALASNYGIISSTNSASVKDIDVNHFVNLMNSKNKTVFFINSDDCTYCERLKPIVGKIGIQNSVNIYSLKIDEKNQKNVELYIQKIGFKEEKITTPLVLISENGKILDYIVGYSDKSIYIEKFKSNGVIR